MAQKARYSMKIKVPASAANLGSGFDTLGLAVQMYLTVEATPGGTGLKIIVEGRDSDKIPIDQSNMIYRFIVKHAGDTMPMGMTLRIKNEIPLTRGFGSSSAAVVSGIALGEWIKNGTPPERKFVIDEATKTEGHPDNVTAAVFGGLTISAFIEDEVITNSLRIPYDLEIVAIIPDKELSTQKAREVLPLTIPRSEAIFNLQRMGLLLTGLFLNRKDLLVHGVGDQIHQNRRAMLYPPMGDAVIRLNKERACLGAFISGAGPSVAAFARGETPYLGEIGVEAISSAGVSAEYLVLAPDYLGLTYL